MCFSNRSIEVQWKFSSLQIVDKSEIGTCIYRLLTLEDRKEEEKNMEKQLTGEEKRYRRKSSCIEINQEENGE